MDTPFVEKLERVESHPHNNTEAEDQQGEAVQEELPQPKRGRRKRVDKNSMKPVNFQWSWEFDARLEHYLADRSGKEHRKVDRTEVVVQAVDEFLTKEGY